MENVEAYLKVVERREPKRMIRVEEGADGRPKQI